MKPLLDNFGWMQRLTKSEKVYSKSQHAVTAVKIN